MFENLWMVQCHVSEALAEILHNHAKEYLKNDYIPCINLSSRESQDFSYKGESARIEWSNEENVLKKNLLALIL